MVERFWTAPRHVYTDATRTRAVPAGSVESAYLEIPKGHRVPMARAVELGLVRRPGTPAGLPAAYVAADATGRALADAEAREALIPTEADERALRGAPRRGRPRKAAR